MYNQPLIAYAIWSIFLLHQSVNFKFQLQNFHSVLVHEQFKIVLIRWVLFLCSVPFTSDCFAADWNLIHKCGSISRFICVCLWGVCHNMPVSKSKSKLQWKIWQAIYRFAKWQKSLMNVSFSQSTDSRSKASDDVYLNLDFSTRIRIQIQIGTAARWCPFESCTRHSWVNIIKHTHTHIVQSGIKRAQANRTQGWSGYLIECCQLISVNRRTQAYY